MIRYYQFIFKILLFYLPVMLFSQTIISGLYINEFMASNSTTVSDEFGGYDDWIEIYNSNDFSVDIGGLYISDKLDNPEKWQIPTSSPVVTSIPSKGYIIIWADEETGQGPLHTNIKLSADGESVILSQRINEQLITLDALSFGPQTTDISYGRYPDGEDNWIYFNEPTPGFPNQQGGEPVNPPIVSHNSGFYTTGFNLILTPASADDTIRFTMNGSEPTRNSPIYTGPLSITDREGDPNYFAIIPPNFVPAGPSLFYPPSDEAVFKCTVLKARAFHGKTPPSHIVTKTYFVDENIFNRYDMPVISLSVNEEDFFSDSIGIYVPGDRYIEGNNETGNYFMRGDEWERSAFMQFFHSNGDEVFAVPVGVRIHGGASRVVPQKSLRIYGRPSLNYTFFNDRNNTIYKRILLRNSGNDRVSSMFRDAFMTSLVRDMDSNMEYQASQPSVLFLNGEFWGIHNIRERIDKYFFSDNAGADPDNIDYLEAHGIIQEGDNSHYFMWYNYLENADMTLQQNYDSMDAWIDIPNFIDYNVAEIFFANVDWPSNNRDYWRPAEPGGKWRWVVFDTDFGFGWESYSHYDHNTLVFATTPDGPTEPPVWSSNSSFATIQLRKMLQNQKFRHDFINRFADMMNTVFSPDFIIRRINLMESFYEYVMPEHIQRWSKPATMSEWRWHVNRMRTFGENRADYMRDFIMDYFNEIEPLAENIDVMVTITLSLENKDEGYIVLNSITPHEYPWNGIYFNNIPIRLEAVAHPGYMFERWVETGSNDSVITVTPMGNQSFTAEFSVDPDYFYPVVINEFMASNVSTIHDENGNYGDWIEIYNPNNETVDIGGYYITDNLSNPEKHHIPEGDPATRILPKGFLLLWADNSPEQGVVHLNFALSKSGESIGLYKPDLNLSDSIIFGPQSDDIAFGRLPDGSPNWVEMTPTPGESNNPQSNIIVPEQFKLYAAYPNPFNTMTTLSFDLPDIAPVNLTIFSIRGEVIRSLVYNEMHYPGTHAIIWDGMNDIGRPAASGIYLALFTTPFYRQTVRMTLLK